MEHIRRLLPGVRFFEERSGWLLFDIGYYMLLDRYNCVSDNNQHFELLCLGNKYVCFITLVKTCWWKQICSSLPTIKWASTVISIIRASCWCFVITLWAFAVFCFITKNLSQVIFRGDLSRETPFSVERSWDLRSIVDYINNFPRLPHCYITDKQGQWAC